MPFLIDVFKYISRSEYRKNDTQMRANVSSYLLPQSDLNYVAWVTSQPRLQIVNLTWKPYGLVGF